MNNVFRFVIVAAASCALAACIQSDGPLLTDSKPLFGDGVRFQMFSLHGGAAHDPEVIRFRWDGKRYVPADAPSGQAAPFTVHASIGQDLILQAANPGSPVDYAVARKIAVGTFLLVAVDEDDADARTRATFCTKDVSPCRVKTTEALAAFVRATVAKPYDRGGLAIRLADDK